MSGASTPRNMTTKLLEVAERARRDPNSKFYSLAYLINEGTLARAYGRLRQDAAVGVDGTTVIQYGQNLRENLQSLYERLKGGRYRHQPIRRVHLPKGGGKTRPIGISTVEDKVVQGALCEVLQAVYEPTFRDCSYGFRPGRSCHDAIRALDRAAFRGEANWVLEADVQSFFDSVNRARLMELLQLRVADGSLRRLVGKCLRVGVLDGDEYSAPEHGTAQGSVLSPLLGNIYLHYVLDQWFQEVVTPRLAGKARLIRYCDDFVITFERQDDAERVMRVLHKRFEKFGLTLHPDKTRLVRFQRPPKSQRSGRGAATFDFLGFTHYWRRTHRGNWQPSCKTQRARLGRAIKAIYEWCRHHRHWSVPDQHAALVRRIRGHFNYFGVNGNFHRMLTLLHHTERAWQKWLNRRSQRAQLPWERFANLLKDFPLPKPQVYVQIWG